MLIDLHCHTRKIKSGDGDGREVSDDLFSQKISSSGVNIVAITNHNIFDKDQFDRLENKIATLPCMLWPGVELDISYGSNGDRYHLLVISSPTNKDAFSRAVEELINGTDPDTFSIDVNSVVSKFNTLDCLFLPHSHGKTQAITDDELETLEGLLSNKSRLIAEASNIRSMGILISHGINSIAGSDVKDWSTYPGMELPELRLQVDSFENFCKLLDRDSTVVKTLLDKNAPTPYDVYPKAGDRAVKERHNFYKEVNVIIGDKGTGKTEIIKSLISKLSTDDTPFVAYVSSETKENLDELLRTDDMDRIASKLGIDSHEDDFKIVVNWGDKTPTPIYEYREFHKTSTANTNKQRIGWSRMPNLSDDTETRLQKVTKDLELVNTGIKDITSVKLEDYLDSTDKTSLVELLEKLKATVTSRQKNVKIENIASKLTNKTINKFKTYTSAKTGSATRPSNTGFGAYAKNRINLRNAMSAIVNDLKFKDIKEYEYLGTIGNKGKVEIERRHRLLNDLDATKSDHKEFPGNITKLRDARDSLVKVNKTTLSPKNDDNLSDLKTKLSDAGVSSMDSFVGIYKQTVDKSREPYILSNGERSIVFIQRTLNDKEAQVFLLDEPELSMANSFIDEVIRPQITALGKQKKTVIMATHNANLAVRTLPYTTIYRSHDSGVYKTYIGNAFTNTLVNMLDDTDTVDWKDTNMKILEGGKDAFYDRGGIYEPGR